MTAAPRARTGQVIMLALAALLPATSARALQRTRTPTGDIPVVWDRTPVALLVDAEPQLPAMAPAAVLDGLRASAARWSQGRNACTSFNLQIETAAEDERPSGAIIDQVSRLVIRRDRWCNPARPEAGCHNPAALAITTVTARKSDGVLLDVDVELNAVNNRWGDLAITGADASGAHDLEAVLTHEFGHFLGFDHSCRLPGEPPASNILACADASDVALDSVMYPLEIPGGLPRREPTPEDLRSLCAIYPALPDTILGDGSVGCTAAGAGSGRGIVSGVPALGWLALLSLAALRVASAGKADRLDRRRRVKSTASAAMSLPSNRQPCPSAASPAGPDPMNGSTTSSPGAAL
jgi:hypothetical protein